MEQMPNVRHSPRQWRKNGIDSRSSKSRRTVETPRDTPQIAILSGTLVSFFGSPPPAAGRIIRPQNFGVQLPFAGSLKRKRGVGNTACRPSLAGYLSFEALYPRISLHPNPSLALQASRTRLGCEELANSRMKFQASPASGCAGSYRKETSWYGAEILLLSACSSVTGFLVQIQTVARGSVRSRHRWG